jgi:hypothetical protein
MAVLIGGISMHIPGRIKEPVRSLHPTKAMLKTLIMEETARGLRMQLFARPSFDISLLEHSAHILPRYAIVSELFERREGQVFGSAALTNRTMHISISVQRDVKRKNPC